ncbi:unnamed protein product [Phytophthora lilii]|uniref:Unnamed protein product n=1 Tax=Phytophthora lilii TaxID=2077276 RepID=A0A9W6TR74_9STRA|nr:unnamed protein product [Phytophthora lilii]
MRQRRHVNGNSNASASTVDASLAWGSGRTVPVNITSTSKRGPSPAAVPDALIESSTATAAVKQERRFGAATARRPQSSSASGHRDPLAGCRPKRRVKDKVTASHRKPTPPTAIAATGIDATSQVQWAVKVATVTPERDNAEPVEMKDLRRLLRDRYGEKRSVRQAFLTWDTNKDGRLCVDELKDMLTRLGFAEALGGKKVDTILQHVLTMPAASLHYDDFCGFVYGLPELNEPTSSSSYNSSISNGRRTFNTRADEEVMPVSDPDCVVSLLRAKYESRRVHQVFRDWDIDKSGGVTLAEIESNLRRQGLWIAKPQLMKLFDTYDLNHDGRLLYDEFMRLVYGPVHQQRYSYLVAQRRKKQQDQQMNDEDPLNFFRSSAAVPHQATHSTDVSCSPMHFEWLSFELQLQELGLNLTEREFLHLATRVDTDGNGEISFKEFCDVFGGGDASNRRRRSNAAGSEDDVSLDNHQHESKMPLKGGGQRRAAGSFDFSHLTR